MAQGSQLAESCICLACGQAAYIVGAGIASAPSVVLAVQGSASVAVLI